MTQPSRNAENWRVQGLDIQACRQQLVTWAEQASTNSHAIRESAAAAVIDWKWSKWWMWNPEPFWFQRGGYPSGRAYKQPPAEPDYHDFQTGFDAQGRARVERLFTSIKRPDGRWYEETVFEHHSDRITWAKYDYSPTKDLRAFMCAWLVGGRVVLVGHYAVQSSGEVRTWFEHFDWSTPGQLRIERDDLDHPSHGGGVTGMYEVGVLDAAGRLTEFRQERPGREPWIQWRRPVKRQTVASLGRRVTAALQDRIVEVAKGWNSPGPAYCLAIVYDDEGNDLFLPLIGIGLDAERKRWATEHGDRLKDFIWNPAEFSNFAQGALLVELPALKEDVRMLNQLIIEQDARDKGVRMIRKLAADLGKIDWSSILEVTDDFIVYSVGTELSDFDADMKACIGARKLNALKKRNLIP